MYAIVEEGSKQYRMEKGAVLLIDRKERNAGEKIEFANVLVFSDGEKVKIGTPYVQGIKVIGEVIGEVKDKKIKVFKYRRREGYHRTIGHREKYTRVKVTEIVAG